MSMADPNNGVSKAPPGPTASTNYATGTMNAGYVWLDGVGWTWQNEQGQIDPAAQHAYGESVAAKERAAAQAGQPSILSYDPGSNTYSYANSATSVGPSTSPQGWMTESEIYAAAQKAGITAQGYTSSYGYDANGNPITRVGITDAATGSTGVLQKDGTISWEEGPLFDATHSVAKPGGIIEYQQQQEASKRAGSPWLYGDKGQKDAWARLTDMLSQYGLGDLNRFAWEAIVNGDSQERILQNLRNTDTYKKRFVGMAERQKNGLPAMSENEYIAYEQSVRQMMRESGLPPEFYDQPADFAKLIGNDVSAREVSTRVSDLFAAAESAPAEVRQVFNDWFGVDGTTAMATYFLDPTKAVTLLSEQLRQAEIGGTAKRFGINVDRNRADQLDRMGVGPQQAAQGFQQITAMKPLFQETINESQDFTAEQEGIGAVFGADANSGQNLKDRLARREADFGGGGGSNLQSGGALGLQNER